MKMTMSKFYKSFLNLRKNLQFDQLKLSIISCSKLILDSLYFEVAHSLYFGLKINSMTFQLMVSKSKLNAPIKDVLRVLISKAAKNLMFNQLVKLKSKKQRQYFYKFLSKSVYEKWFFKPCYRFSIKITCNFGFDSYIQISSFIIKILSSFCIF